MRLRFVLCAVVSLTFTDAASAQRLSTSVTPVHYDLTFDIDLAHARFSGKTGIDVRLTRPSGTIRLNALDLDITAASVRVGDARQPATVAVNKEDETATLTVAAPVAAGSARIEIEYRAALNDSLRGLYLSKGRDRSYAVTQLESTDARRAFPCFDEPSFKATFAVTVIADRGDVAISNGRMTGDTPGPTPTRHTMTFSTTPKMSSYLVAIAVGDFQCLDGSSDAIPIRICATPDKKALGAIALESAEQVMSYLNRYYSIKYPFGKLDVVAVPDFAAGAMENAAAIFYRESDLLADSASASLATRKTIFSILSHEMAHMWFGDLVTMQWWDDVWLNEGFATWMATRPAKALKPEWAMDVTEGEETQTALALDSLRTTHPIHVTVDTPGEIESVFDRISYEKGASVLRMVENYVGEDAFRTGINAYLQKHAYGNATSEDFFAALTQASGKPVDRILGTFVLQAGVPQVEVSATCANGRSSVTLTQSRFTLDGTAAADRERWQIPICLKTASTDRPLCTVLTEPTQTLSVGRSCSPWVFANAGGKGYYRTVYAPALVKPLASDIEHTLSAPERLSLISDEWALVRNGRHELGSYLDLVSGLGDESDPDVLDAAVGRFFFIDDYLTGPETRQKFHAFVASLLRPSYERLGFDRRPGDTDAQRTLRGVVVDALGSIVGDPDVVAKARQAVLAALNGNTPLDPIVARKLVNIAAVHGDASLFDAMMRASSNATSPEERYRYLYALTNFSDPALVQRALEHALSPALRSQDTAIYLASFTGNDAARDRAWAFIKAHWAELAPKVTISLGDINLVNGLGSFCSVESRDDVRSFFASHKLPAAGRAVQQTTEVIDNCIRTRDKQTPALARWLESRSQ